MILASNYIMLSSSYEIQLKIDPVGKLNEIFMFTAKAQRTQRFTYFLFSCERPRRGGITIRC